MSVCQQRDISMLSHRPASHRVRMVEAGCSKSGAFIWTVTSQEVTVTPFPGCARSRLMQFILKVPGKFVLAFHVVTMAVVPTPLSPCSPNVLLVSLCPLTSNHQLFLTS
ncbi:hypothetical protein GOODEAATRI_034181 [Goodea atripinnis]|uniref:Uncharacterized protein n=1 Tax=Goodea atripinnis TaxID=208336 RepID=A0ABV0N6H2_9TELE